LPCGRRTCWMRPNPATARSCFTKAAFSTIVVTSRPLRCPIISPASPHRRRWHDGQGAALLRRDRRAGIPALPQPARPLLRFPGASARLAGDLRDRLAFNGRPVGPPALRERPPPRGKHPPRGGAV